MSNMDKATKEIMAVFDEMYEEELLHEDTFDAIASAKTVDNASAKAVDNASVKAVDNASAKAEDAKALAGKRKFEQEQELEPDQVMTTEEAVMLALAASQYYTNQNTDGDYDDLAQSGTFGLNVYKKARDVLKPKYKELFDVKAIAKRFKTLANMTWD